MMLQLCNQSEKEKLNVSTQEYVRYDANFTPGKEMCVCAMKVHTHRPPKLVFKRPFSIKKVYINAHKPLFRASSHITLMFMRSYDVFKSGQYFGLYV